MSALFVSLATSGLVKRTDDPAQQQIITRGEALAAGLKTYFTGVPCQHGHVAPRGTVNKLCRACNAERKRVRRRAAAARRPLSARSQAMAAGAEYYFTGKPCPNGHVVERKTANGNCPLCRRAAAKAYVAKNPEKVRARRLAYRKNNFERIKTVSAARKIKNKDRIKAVRAAYYAKNRAARLEYSKAYRAANAEAMRERKRKAYHANKVALAARRKELKPRYAEQQRQYAREYRRRFPEKRATLQRNREAKKRAAGTHTLGDIAAIRKAQSNRCAYCRVSLSKTQPHVDHITPISKGGSNDRRNLQILCYRCNTAKRDKDPIEFSRWIGRLI